MLATLRRMVAEPTVTTYTDTILSTMLASYPLPDADGEDPDDMLWAGAWDLNQAAADIWDEKAAALAAGYDFAADGGDYKRSQAHAQALAMARKFRSRRQARSLRMVAEPHPLWSDHDHVWLGNAAEEDDY